MASTDRFSHTDRLRFDRQSGHLHRSRYQIKVESGPDTGASLLLDGTIFVGSHEACALRLTDSAVSRYHLELVPAGGGIRVRDLQSTNGTFLSGARIESVVVGAGARVNLGATTLRVDSVDEDLGEAPGHRSSFGKAIGESLVMRRLFSVLERAAKSNVAVVLYGETGTGKELLAEGLHSESSRKGRFVVVDCSSLTHGLVESELFGHVQGAFTDARTDRLGAFREADGGTLLLDDVSALPLQHQPKLLRVLETETIKAVGGVEGVKVDVRVVATASEDLEKAVNQGRFRQDLYFRLAVVSVWVPPLRDRIEDLPHLCRRFLSEQKRPDFELSPELLQQLRSHSWPGNVRELRNTVERALIGFNPSAESAKPPPSAASMTGLTYKDAKEQILEAFEKEYLAALIKQCHGNLSEVGRIAGINRNHVRKLAQRHGLVHKE
jgi:DNA-binding NtrC family response regulator